MVDFLEELPTVFKILQNNPEAIIDDTATERLFGWIDDVSKQHNDVMFSNLQSITESDIMKSNSVVLSFSLRVFGYLGKYMPDKSHLMYDIITKKFDDVQKHESFYKSDAVKYSFFASMNQLATNAHFVRYLNSVCWDMLSSIFVKSSHFVKKCAITFLSTLIMTSSKTDFSADVITSVKDLINKNAGNIKHLECVGESIHQIIKKDFMTGIHVIYNTNYMNITVKTLSSSNTQKKNQLLEIIATLFKTIQRSDLCEEVVWERLLDNCMEVLIELLQYSLNESTLRKLFAQLCTSLLITTSYSRYFPVGWNVQLITLLQYLFVDHNSDDVKKVEIFSDVNLQETLSVIEQKQLFITVVTAINDVITSNKIDFEKDLHSRLFSRFIDHASITLNCHTDDVITDDFSRSLICEQKVTRILLQYFSICSDKHLSDDVITKYSKFLSSALALTIEPPQITCSILNIVSDWLVSNTSYLMDNDDQQSVMALQLSMKLSHQSWEIKDSVLNLLNRILRFINEVTSQSSKQCEDFFVKYQYWCKLLPLLNHHESYVRSSTIQVIVHVLLNERLWRVFSQYNSYNEVTLFERFVDIFLDDKRLDDMFTRRSILQALSIATEENKIKFKNEGGLNKIFECVLEIVTNSFRDFDWEVRKLNQSFITCLVKSAVNQNCALYVCEVFLSKDILSGIIESCFDDCEMLVNVEALNCLRKLGDVITSPSKFDNELCTPETNVLDIHNIKDTNQAREFVKKNPIKTIEDILNFHTRIDYESLLCSLEPLDNNVTSDPVSFIHDVIASTKQSEENLLDCY